MVHTLHSRANYHHLTSFLLAFIDVLMHIGGEIGVLSGIGLVLIGRKDLPVAAHALGRQVGRIVGLLQGARIRADRFATDHQLKQLQNEFKSGLRELDAVKAEMASAMVTSSVLAIATATALLLETAAVIAISSVSLWHCKHKALYSIAPYITAFIQY